LVTRVVYVACDPASLARDAAELVKAGFAPVALQLFDLFPQTRHIEAVMAFAR
jgi:23S rRNA (uracil1939-C5)-methyltransferase